jgi:trehalose synthase
VASSALTRVEVRPLPLARFASILPRERYAEFQEVARRTSERLRGTVVWNLNSTAAGGGVAEILTSLIAYAVDGGVDARWLVVHARPDFFTLTKRLHNNLHGAPGDGGGLGTAEHILYQRGLGPAAEELADLVSPDDVVILHDPQTAGLVRAARQAGARVVWRCHIGIDQPDPLAERAWDFLRPYLADADAIIMSRRSFAWQGWDPEKLHIVAPSIDAFSAKNIDLDAATVRGILAASAVVHDPGYDAVELVVPRDGGGTTVVRHRAEMIEDQPVDVSADLVVQVSRWDRLKDPCGVVEGFATRCARFSNAHLMLAGPQAVADDPESAGVIAEVIAERQGLPDDMRARVHLAALSMADVEENAVVVNALQRHAEVVVQKSLAEGFGLTVAEAMWKARPVVASRVGGIQDQIVDGESGILIDDPRDLVTFGDEVARLLADPDLRRRLGDAARARVIDDFLATRHLEQWAMLVGGFVD